MLRALLNYPRYFSARPLVEPMLKVAQEQFKKLELAKAAESYKQAIKIDPTCREAYDGLWEVWLTNNFNGMSKVDYELYQKNFFENFPSNNTSNTPKQ